MNSLAPEGYKVMLAFEKYLNGTSLSEVHKNLIRIRASQINGCSYCVDMHTQEAREAGESERRIYALTTWRETPFFSDDERAVLALTEEVTLLTQRVSEQTYPMRFLCWVKNMWLKSSSRSLPSTAGIESGWPLT